MPVVMQACFCVEILAGESKIESRVLAGHQGLTERRITRFPCNLTGCIRQGNDYHCVMFNSVQKLSIAKAHADIRSHIGLSGQNKCAIMLASFPIDPESFRLQYRPQKHRDSAM